jgi:hypothetical protein
MSRRNVAFKGLFSKKVEPFVWNGLADVEKGGFLFGQSEFPNPITPE